MFWIYNATTTLYHPPIITIILIVMNVVISVGSIAGGPQTYENWMLWFGDGYHVGQWFTSVFIHASVGHLVGNMMFLWPFGLVVEGKLGWWKFLILFLLIAAGQSAIQQTIMLRSTTHVTVDESLQKLTTSPEFARMPPADRAAAQNQIINAGDQRRGALGASGVIYGLLVACLLWAPISEFTCLFWYGLALTTFELPILVVGGTYITLEGLKWVMAGFGMDSQLLHLTGCISGGIFAYLFLQLGLAECDDEDAFSHFGVDPQNSLSGKRVSATKRKKTVPTIFQQSQTISKQKQTKGFAFSWPLKRSPRRKSEKPKAEIKKQTKTIDERIQEVLRVAKEGDSKNAADLLREISSSIKLRQIPLNAYNVMYQQAIGSRDLRSARTFLEKSISAHKAKATSRKLELARLLITGIKDVRSGEILLDELAFDDLNTQQKQKHEALVERLSQAKAQRG